MGVAVNAEPRGMKSVANPVDQTGDKDHPMTSKLQGQMRESSGLSITLPIRY
jgi:hypothetical protein